MGWLALNKLGTVVSTYHLCMKYSVGKEVEKVWADHQANRPNVNVLNLDLDLRCDNERERPLPTEDLKEINIGPDPAYKTRIGTTLVQEGESRLISFL
ncbi:hypothetical protein CR513_44320, partial [Mucuna pruriens]